MVWSRRGADFTHWFPTIAEAIRGLNVDRALIDGEAVVLRDDGGSDFRALMTKRGGAQASLVAFDLLRRKATISACVRSRRGTRSCGSSTASAESCSAKRWPPRAVVFAKACKLGLEAVLALTSRCGTVTWVLEEAVSPRCGRGAMVEPREWSHRIRRCLTLLIAAASIGNAVAAESVITYHNAANRSGLYVAPTLTWTKAPAVKLDTSIHAGVEPFPQF